MTSGLLAASVSRGLGDLAMLLGSVGGLVLAWSAWAFLAGANGEIGRRRERIRTLIGSLMIAGAFLLLLVSRLAGGSGA